MDCTEIEYISEYVEKDQKYFIAKHDGKEVGWLLFSRENGIDVALSTIVLEEYRRQGIMTSLMKRAYKDYRSNRLPIYSTLLTSDEEKKFYSYLQRRGYAKEVNINGKRYEISFSKLSTIGNILRKYI